MVLVLCLHQAAIVMLSEKQHKTIKKSMVMMLLILVSNASEEGCGQILDQ